MKYLVISDIHGSSKYLKLILEKVRDYDKLIILGDILYHGPRNDLPNEYDPKEVIKILNELKDKIIAIRGNCDADVDLMVLEFEIKKHRYEKLGNTKFLLTHGDYYNYECFPSKNFKYYMLHGHTHVNKITKVNDSICIINLGSLSLPKDNHYSYAIIENGIYSSYDLLTNEKIIEMIL